MLDKGVSKEKMKVDTKTIKEVCGYRVIENNENYCMVEMYGKKKKMANICLQPLKIDQETLENGSLDALLAR